MHHLNKHRKWFVIVICVATLFFIIVECMRIELLNSLIRSDADKSEIEKSINKLSRHEIDAVKISRFIYHPLNLACEKGNYDVVNLLVEKGVDVNARDRLTGNTPILSVLIKGNTSERCEIAMFLIEHGADINVENKSGDTVIRRLMKESPDSKEAIELFKYLYLNTIPSYEYASFQLAADDDMPELVDWLIKEQGFSYSDLRQEDGSYLHYCYRMDESGNLWRKPKMIEYIVNCKLEDINTQDKEGRTVLSVAAEKNEVEDCKLFLKLGADPTIKDNSGKTAYDYAMENGNTEVAELLRRDMK